MRVAESICRAESEQARRDDSKEKIDGTTPTESSVFATYYNLSEKELQQVIRRLKTELSRLERRFGEQDAELTGLWCTTLDQRAAEFHKFPDLPIELQLHIIQFVDPNTQHAFASTSHTCRENMLSYLKLSDTIETLAKNPARITETIEKLGGEGKIREAIIVIDELVRLGCKIPACDRKISVAEYPENALNNPASFYLALRSRPNFLASYSKRNGRNLLCDIITNATSISLHGTQHACKVEPEMRSKAQQLLLLLQRVRNLDFDIIFPHSYLEEALLFAVSRLTNSFYSNSYVVDQKGRYDICLIPVRALLEAGADPQVKVSSENVSAIDKVKQLIEKQKNPFPSGGNFGQKKSENPERTERHQLTEELLLLLEHFAIQKHEDNSLTSKNNKYSNAVSYSGCIIS